MFGREGWGEETVEKDAMITFGLWERT